MREQILEDLITAMKSRDKETLSVLRMVKGAMQLEEIQLKRQLNDTEMSLLMGKQIKTRKDSIIEFNKGNRDDLVQKTEAEIKILERYMPKQLTEEEIKTEVQKAIDIANPESSKDMGRVMKELSHLKGKADMALVNQMVRKMLENK